MNFLWIEKIGWGMLSLFCFLIGIRLGASKQRKMRKVTSLYQIINKP